MSQVYSTRLIAKRQSYAGTPLFEVYTVPAGHVLVVVDVECWSFVSPGDYRFRLVVAAGNVRMLAATGPADGKALQWTGRLVVNAGESIACDCYAGDCAWIVSGYLLTLP